MLRLCKFSICILIPIFILLGCGQRSQTLISKNRISGTVIGASNVTMQLGGDKTAILTTESDGATFEFAELDKGSYSVTPTKEGCVFIPSNRKISIINTNVTDVNFIASMETYSISGNVGTSEVTITLTGEVLSTSGLVFDCDTKIATSDSSGNYCITGLLNGTYYLSPSKNQYRFSPVSNIVIVRAADQTGIIFNSYKNMAAIEAANIFGMLSNQSLTVDDYSIGAIGITSAGLSIKSSTTPSMQSDGWWMVTDTYYFSGTSIIVTRYIRIWDKNGSEAVNNSQLDALTKSVTDIIWLYGAYQIESPTINYLIRYGLTKGEPLKYIGKVNSPETISGPILFEEIYEGQNAVLTLTYPSLTVSGYPIGIANCTVCLSGFEIYEGKVTFDGTKYAILNFNSGSSASYRIDLDTGIVSSI